MQLSELSRRSGVPVPSIKFYLREGLLHRGQLVASRSSLYDESHLRRLQLIKILIDVNGLSVSGTRKVIAALDMAEADHVTAVADGVAALSGTQGTAPGPAGTGGHCAQLLELAERHGRNDSNVAALARALDAAAQAGMPVDEVTLSQFRTVLRALASGTLANLPADAAEAVEHVVVGTAIHGRILSALWFLSRREVAAERLTNPSGV